MESRADIMFSRRTLVLTLFLTLACRRPDNSTGPISVSLCNVVTAPASYNGRLVRIHASVLSDGMHDAALIDFRCSGLGLGLTYAEAAQNLASIGRLNDAIFRTGFAGTTDKEITGNFTGTVRVSSHHWWHTARPRDRCVLELTSISDLRVRPKPMFWELKKLQELPTRPTAPHEQSEVIADVLHLTVDDIAWNLTPFGLWPKPRSRRAERIQRESDRAIPLLRDALHDPSRYAAAHVFLTWATDSTFEPSSTEFNHLTIVMRSDLPPYIPDQQNDIERLWVVPVAQRQRAPNQAAAPGAEPLDPTSRERYNSRR